MYADMRMCLLSESHEECAAAIADCVALGRGMLVVSALRLHAPACAFSGADAWETSSRWGAPYCLRITCLLLGGNVEVYEDHLLMIR